MSLWHKDMASVTFEDVEAFCKIQHREGLRLDYKSELPNDLEKLVCAFANTLGGLILVGVKSEGKNNTPIWPPQGFVQVRGGVSERVVSSCRDSIHPSVRPQISPVLPNPHSAGTDVVVIRVDESREAPHSVDGMVYERTGDMNFPHKMYKPAHIARIEQLLLRRGKVEEQREEFLQREIGRALRRLAYSRLSMPEVPDLNHELKVASQKNVHQRPLLPVRWVSVIPLFPWRDLCEYGLCFELLRADNFVEHPQRAPGGAFGITLESGVEGNPGFVKSCSSLGTRGHVFAAEITTETITSIATEKRLNRNKDYLYVDIEETRQFVYRTLRNAQSFYQHVGVERPGLLQVAVGLADVWHFRMAKAGGHGMAKAGDHGSGKPFVDESFRTEAVIPVETLLKSQEEAAVSVLRDLALGFDAV